MKRIITAFIACMLLTCTAGAVDLYVDTNKVATDTPPAIVEGRTLVPVRAIFEAIGATVEWDNSTRTATGEKDGTIVSIQIDNTTAYVNGEARTLDVPAQLINNRTMVPARFISEAMGCDVTWYQNTQTAAVADKIKGQHIYVTKTGKRDHFSGTCNGGTYYEATLAEAMGRGLEPCDKCVLTIDNSVPPTSETTPPASEATQGQRNALNSAKSYLGIMAFSYDGLIKQLEYEKYTHDDAVYAADHCGADWSSQAGKKAKSYLEIMPFSYAGLIKQLEFDEFTHEQAVCGVEQCGADWNAQAAKKAKSYLELMSFSRDSLIEQLKFDGYTHDQAVYGASQNGY